MAIDEHNRILAAAGKAALHPLGFKRKGQSRVWIADEGFWLNIVEFQPSHLDKGTFLNVAVHWLWGRPPHVLSFDRSERIGDFVSFENPETYEVFAAQIAEKAASASLANREKFESLSDAAAIVLGEEMSRDIQFGRWSVVHAGILAGLTGHTEDARHVWGLCKEPQAQDLIRILSDKLSQPKLFREYIEELIAIERAYYKLPVLSNFETMVGK